MSIKVASYTWEHSQHKGSALLLLLAIADHAHEDGGGAYPSIGTLAAKIRMTPRNTQLLLRKLEASGELVIDQGAGPHGCNVYRVIMGALMAGVKTFQGDPAITGGVNAASPKPSVNRHREGGREGTHARANANAPHTQPNSEPPRVATPSQPEAPTRAAAVPPAAAALVVQRDMQHAVINRWQQIFGTPAGEHAQQRLERLLAGWATVHSWQGMLATLQYADQQYPDLPTKPNPVKLIGTLLDTAKQEGRPYGSDTRAYTQHKEQQHERQRNEWGRTQHQRKHAVVGADHAVQPVRESDGARPAVAARAAPRFVQRLRERAQAHPSG